MALFGKSRQIIRRAWRRFLDSFRWNLRAVRLYHIPISMEVQVFPLAMKSEPQLFDQPMIDTSTECGDATLDATVDEVLPELDFQVRSEKPPKDIEAAVVAEDLKLLSKGVSDEPVNLSNPIVRIIERGLRMATALKGFEPRRWTAKTMGLRVATPAMPIREGLNFVANLPVLRTSIAFLRLPPEARLGYWRELVSQVQRQPKELELLGIFPNVPITGIEKASIDAARGGLKLWYGHRRNDALNGTLLVARERETGRIHRVFDRRSISDQGK